MYVRIYVMYTYHLKNILESNSWNNKLVIEKMKQWDCSVEKEPIPGTDRVNIWVHGWQERLTPPHAPSDYLKLIDRLDREFEYEYKEESYVPTSRVSHSGRIYTTLTSSKNRFNFQASKSKTRAAVTWRGKPLESFDVSAAQLRIALALRGQVLPAKVSPWDELVIDHRAEDWVTADIARELKKSVALLLIKGQKKFDLPKMWAEKIGASEEFRPVLKGYTKAVWHSLLIAYPVLKDALEPIYKTPDGYRISKKSETYRKHDFHSRPYKIKTSFKDFASEPPTENNVLEAFEAYVLRQVIGSLPAGSPILTCHDQVYVLEGDLSHVGDEFYVQITHLAPIHQASSM
jgi:hypothetical protein